MIEKAKPKRDAKGRFPKGVSGNPAGPRPGCVRIEKAPNLKDAILRAGELRGQQVEPGTENGMISYLTHLAEKEPRAYASLLGRVLPLLPTPVALPPIEKPADLIAASSALAKAVSDGELAPTEGSAIANIVGAVGKAIELHALEARLQALEQRLDEKGSGR